ncbi:MAG: hypothetical protein ACOYL6_14770 [Bacteriovoracaceae bacterium]
MRFKLAIVTLVLFTSLQNAFSGLYLKNCTYPISDATLIAVGVIHTECDDKDNNKYSIDFFGVGVGLEMSAHTIGVACPFVNKKRILKGKPLVVVGPKASAGLFLGGEVGAGVNLRGAICGLAGFSIPIYGASALIGGYKIKYLPPSPTDTRDELADLEKENGNGSAMVNADKDNGNLIFTEDQIASP